MVQPKPQPVPRVLRVGVVREGRIVDERLVPRGKALSIGSSERCDIQLPFSSLPPRFELFKPVREGYVLNLTEEMDGKLRWKDAVVPVRQLVEEQAIRRRGGSWALPLREDSRGKVHIEGTTLLFQFVPMPPEPLRPRVSSYRPRLWDDDDPVYYGFLGLFSAVAAVALVIVYNTPIVENRIVELPPPMVAVLMEAPPPVVEEPVPLAIEDPDAAGPELEVADREEEVVAEAEPEPEPGGGPRWSEEELERMVEEDPLLSTLRIFVLGQTGENARGETVERPFGMDTGSDARLSAALEDVRGAELASLDEGPSLRGSRTGRDDIDVEGRTAAEGEGVGVGEGPGSGVESYTVELLPPPEIPDEARDVIIGVVRANRGFVKSCYEQESRLSPGLQGRIEVSWTILADGHTADIYPSADQPEMDAVAACVGRSISRWVFPPEAAGYVTYPFVLTPSAQ